MLADSEPQEYMTTHQTGSQLARPNKKEGSEMGKYPHIRTNGNAVYLPEAENSGPP